MTVKVLLLLLRLLSHNHSSLRHLSMLFLPLLLLLQKKTSGFVPTVCPLTSSSIHVKFSFYTHNKKL